MSEADRENCRGWRTRIVVNWDVFGEGRTCAILAASNGVFSSSLSNLTSMWSPSPAQLRAVWPPSWAWITMLFTFKPRLRSLLMSSNLPCTAALNQHFITTLLHSSLCSCDEQRGLEYWTSYYSSSNLTFQWAFWQTLEQYRMSSQNAHLLKFFSPLPTLPQFKSSSSSLPPLPLRLP